MELYEINNDYSTKIFDIINIKSIIKSYSFLIENQSNIYQYKFYLCYYINPNIKLIIFIKSIHILSFDVYLSKMNYLYKFIDKIKNELNFKILNGNNFSDFISEFNLYHIYLYLCDFDVDDFYVWRETTDSLPALTYYTGYSVEKKSKKYN